METWTDGTVLIPGAGEPVGCERRGKRAADDKSKIAPSCRRNGRAGASLVEKRKHLRGITGAVRNRFVEFCQAGDALRIWRNTAYLDARQVAAGPRAGVGQQFVHPVDYR